VWHSLWRPSVRDCTVLLVVLASTAISAGCSRTRRLNTIEHGGNGPPILVLLHGYGSSAEQWAPFTKTISWPERGRFVFPQAPDFTFPPDGPPDGRAWWRLDLASHIPPGHSIPDLSASQPPGIKTAASLVEDLLGRLEQSPGGPIVLGGYSQGAMVASEVAFRSDTPIRALVLLSGTMVDEASWERNFSRRRELPVFIAHGRADTILPFAVADRFRLKLEAAGVKVTWHPFEGGHQIPGEVIRALNAFLDTLVAG
jgi:phospholipase/carboxylesterase